MRKMAREEAHEETVRAVVHAGGRGEAHNEDVVDREDHAEDERRWTAESTTATGRPLGSCPRH
jgi:hypothetical protein